MISRGVTSQKVYIFFLLAYRLAAARRSSTKQNTSTTSFFGIKDDFNFGHIGYVYLESDGKIPSLEISNCQQYDTNQTACNIWDGLSNVDAQVPVLRAWAATTFRDNAIVILNYVIHRTTYRAIPESVSAAMHLIYGEIRRNAVKIMDLMPRLKEFVKPILPNQFLILLNLLKHTVRPFTRSAVDVIYKYFSKRKKILHEIFRDQNLHLLNDISVPIIREIEMKQYKRNYDRAVAAIMGKQFALFFREIRSGRILLTQPVLAVLILSMKLEDVSAMDFEKLRFLSDILRLERIEGWIPAKEHNCCNNYRDPRDLIFAKLQELYEHGGIDETIKSSVGGLLALFKNSVTQDEDSKRREQLFVIPRFNVTLFVNLLEVELNTPQVREFRRMIMEGQIDIAYAFKGFLRHFYGSFEDFLRGFMERVKWRVPMDGASKKIVRIIIQQLNEKCLEKTSTVEVSTSPQIQEEDRRRNKKYFI